MLVGMRFFSTNGLTLTSILVALALSGIVAVFSTRMVTDQMALANTAVLLAKGDSVFRFFNGIISDSDVWEKTLEHSSNSSLKTYVKGHGTSVDSSSTRNTLTLIDHLNKVVIPSGGVKLKDTISTNVTGGWWDVKLSWIKMGHGSVDLIFELCLDKTNFQSAPENDGRKAIANSFGYLCPKKREARIRYSENSLKATNCGGKAVVAVNHHSHPNSRRVTCSTYNLINPTLSCGDRTFVHEVGSGIGVCASGRVGAQPITCYNGSFVQINRDGTLSCSSDRFLVKKSQSSCPHPYVVCGFNSSRGVQCCNSTGPTGAQGPRGIIGDRGPPGFNGRKGADGPKGYAQTIKGPVGFRGRRGPKGEPGQCAG